MNPSSLPRIALALCAVSFAQLGMTPTQAAELYRWTEPDGSITFSPDPPPAGTSFERVGDVDPSSSSAPVRAPASAEPLSSSTTGADRPMQADTSVDAGAVSSSASRAPELNYAPPPAAPPLLGAALQRTDDRTTPSNTAPRQNGRVGSLGTGGGSQQRDERCRELEKRVISLERRLSTRLSADDMDNTVLYMARYQQNVERHCRG